MQKMFVSMLATETNTFSPMPTGLNVWKDTLLLRKSDPPESAPPMLQAALAMLRSATEDRGWELETGLFAFAQPAGRTPRALYEELRDELLADLQAAMPVDAVLLLLHGAMVADGYDDCEGDLLRRVREIVGPHVPVGAELDLHCHITQQMLDHATALVGYKEYPHVDIAARMLDLLAIVTDAAEGKVRPVMSTFDCRMIGMFHTTREPMRSFVDDLAALEGSHGVLNAWVGHGFPYGDVPDLGATLVVVTDDNKPHGDAIAEEMGRKFFAMRDHVRASVMTVAECLTKAAIASAHPVTIADTGDNAGGGAPSDSTFFLAEMIERGIENAAIAPLWDPVAVTVCQDAGVGSTIQLRIGGKMGPSSGNPVDVTATVIALADDLPNALNGVDVPLGASAAIKVHLGEDRSIAPERGIDVVLNSRRGQAYATTIFSELGIDPTQKRMLVVKSTQHFYAAFEPISAQVMYAGDLGALTRDMGRLPFTRANAKRLWPCVQDPFAD